MAEAAVQSATGMGPNSRKLVSDTVLQEGILVCNGYELLPPSLPPTGVALRRSA